MANIAMPKKGEVERWYLWIMALAIIGLFSTCCYLYNEIKVLTKDHTAAMKECEGEIRKAQRVFTKYMLLKDSITTAQQIELNKINRKLKK